MSAHYFNILKHSHCFQVMWGLTPGSGHLHAVNVTRVSRIKVTWKPTSKLTQTTNLSVAKTAAEPSPWSHICTNMRILVAERIFAPFTFHLMSNSIRNFLYLYLSTYLYLYLPGHSVRLSSVKVGTFLFIRIVSGEFIFSLQMSTLQIVDKSTSYTFKIVN